MEEDSGDPASKRVADPAVDGIDYWDLKISVTNDSSLTEEEPVQWLGVPSGVPPEVPHQQLCLYKSSENGLEKPKPVPMDIETNWVSKVGLIPTPQMFSMDDDSVPDDDMDDKERFIMDRIFCGFLPDQKIMDFKKTLLE